MNKSLCPEEKNFWLHLSQLFVSQVKVTLTLNRKEILLLEKGKMKVYIVANLLLSTRSYFHPKESVYFDLIWVEFPNFIHSILFIYQTLCPVILSMLLSRMSFIYFTSSNPIYLWKYSSVYIHYMKHVLLKWSLVPLTLYDI